MGKIKVLIVCLIAAIIVYGAVPYLHFSGGGARAEVVNESQEVSVIAVGDIMFHIPQVKSALSGNTYDFTPAFKDVKGYISGADIAIGNFESVVYPGKKLSGYPRFNAPPQTIDALKKVGFDVLTTANNHIMDMGREGMMSTDNLIKKKGMIPIGTGTKSASKYTIINKKGIRVGILAYTYGTNVGGAPKYLVNYMDLDKIKKDLSEIKKRCDFTIVYFHSGTEYVRTVEDKQRAFFHRVADLGADCILSSHPHVTRDSETYITHGREVYINYSMGNFLSNQNDMYTDIGLMIKLNLKKDNGTVKLAENEVIPVYRLRYKEGGKLVHRIVLCSDIDNYENKLSSKDIAYVRNMSENIIINDAVPAFNQSKGGN